jgi:hypothetical protein
MFVEDYGKTKFDFDKQNNIKLTSSNDDSS